MRGAELSSSNSTAIAGETPREIGHRMGALLEDVQSGLEAVRHLAERQVSQLRASNSAALAKARYSSELEERHGAQFLRVHRNALVSRRAVRALEKHFDAEEGEGWAVRLNGIEESLSVSRRQLSAVREALERRSV